MEWAASFAERFGAELHVVQVVVPEHPADTEHGAAEATRAHSAADELQVYTTQLAGERGHAHVVIDDDPAMAIVRSSEDQAVDVLIVGQRGDGGPQGVPPRQRAEPDQPQRSLHGDHREHDERPDDRGPREPSVHDRDPFVGTRNR